tara:strand:- start:2390 stop:2917 length:528 start_codon:yes stop_codon:yes gene_type:complete
METPEECQSDSTWDDEMYQTLYRIAQRDLANETPGHSLQPTLLVNDAYMRLLEQRNFNLSDRSQVLAAGAVIIRRILVDYARKRKAQKRGGMDGRGIALHISVADHANQIDLLELNDGLEALHSESPRAAQVVELKFFGGLGGEEIAHQLGISLRTVNNDWRFARAWLNRKLGSN